MRSAAFVSLAGVLAPFILGSGVALLMLRSEMLFTPGVAAWEAMLFTGSAMAITAFPMLARIIYERGLSGTSLGTLALAAGSIDDALAWCLLAVVLASFGSNPMIAISAIGGGLVYALFILLVLRPLLKRLDSMAQQTRPSHWPHARLYSNVGDAGSLVYRCGRHLRRIWRFYYGDCNASGHCHPRAAKNTGASYHQLFAAPILYLFWAKHTFGTYCVTGNVANIDSGGSCRHSWQRRGLLGAARLSGETNRDAMAIGTLMNARGLMELILLNIGLERGVITPTMFTVMVIIGGFATLMASPLFEWVYRGVRRPTTRAASE